MRLRLATRVECSFERAVAEARSPHLFEHVAAPLIGVKPIEPSTFPEVWAEGTYWVTMKLFGLLPLGRQAIVASYPDTEAGTFILRDNGHSAIIETWDHRITLEQQGNGVLYRDEVEVSAGFLTPVIWLFAQVFFRHRQRRLRKLAERNFDYSNS